MFLNSLFLAISSSIDSLGIGITYGIKKTKISFSGKIVLFIICFFITLFSLCFGNIIKSLFSDFLTKIIGSLILTFMGIFMCFESLKKTNKDTLSRFNIFKNPTSSDFDKSNMIDSKEALFLAIILSLDSFCIGIGGSIIGISINLFPMLAGMFQLIFLSFGIFIGAKINKLCTLPENIWSIISGLLLIIMGILKLFFKG